MTSRYTAGAERRSGKDRKSTKREGRTDAATGTEGAQKAGRSKQKKHIMQKREASRFCPRFLRGNEDRKRILSGSDDTAEESGFSGERNEYGFPALVYIMRHRSASPAKSRTLSPTREGRICAFFRRKITAGNFCRKPVGLERDTVRTSELPS